MTLLRVAQCVSAETCQHPDRTPWDNYMDRRTGPTLQSREHALHLAKSICLPDAQGPRGSESGQLTARFLRMCSWTSRIWDSRRSMSRCSRT